MEDKNVDKLLSDILKAFMFFLVSKRIGDGIKRSKMYKQKSAKEKYGEQ